MILKKLASGAELKIQLAPFADARALFQAVLEEAKALKINSQDEIDVNLFKDVFCAGLSSKKIEACLSLCMKRVTYNDLKIDENTFEPELARGDYMEVCWEVLQENILPFVKNLYAKYAPTLKALKSFQA